MSTPLISVLMAAYNAARYLDSAVASVLSQVYTDWELIAVDDGSADETWPLLAAWATRDARIRIFRNDRNDGVGTTRARCLDLARGEYSAVMDSDDVALPSWLAQRVALLDRRRDVVLASGPLQAIGERDEDLGSRPGKGSPVVLKWRLLFGNPIHDPSAVFRTSAARQVGGYQSQPYMPDWSLGARLSEVGQVVQEGAPQMKYRIHPESTSARLGPDKGRLESVAHHIMARNLDFHTHIELPERLAWYLFRGRFPFRGEPIVSRAALRVLCEAYTKFIAVHGGTPGSAQLPAAFLDDVANVLRTGGWTFRTLCEMVSVAFRPFFPRAALHPACLKSAAKGYLLPLTAKYRLRATAETTSSGKAGAAVADEKEGAASTTPEVAGGSRAFPGNASGSPHAMAQPYRMKYRVR